jgi:hypothetical protein
MAQTSGEHSTASPGTKKYQETIDMVRAAGEPEWNRAWSDTANSQSK